MGMLIHCAEGPVPVPRRSTEEPLINVLFHVARCLPQRDALSIWESAIRRDLVGVEVLERIHWRSQRAATIAGMAGSRSDSGMETAFVELMRAIGVEVHQQQWVDGHPLDGLIGRHLGIQLDGFRFHSSAADRRRDLRADARLALRGFTILRFDYQQVFFEPEYVQTTVLTAIAQGLHR